MNYKLEKFWKSEIEDEYNNSSQWTINLKSFEILMCGDSTKLEDDEL